MLAQLDMSGRLARPADLGGPAQFEVTRLIKNSTLNHMAFGGLSHPVLPQDLSELLSIPITTALNEVEAHDVYLDHLCSRLSYHYIFNYGMSLYATETGYLSIPEVI